MALVIERRFGEAIIITVDGVGELVVKLERSTSSNRVDLVITGPMAFDVGRLEKNKPIAPSRRTPDPETTLP